MTTATKHLSSNSFDYPSNKSEATCNICQRLLYAFEEILRCRICYGAYHWRCLKPQRVSRYGQNNNYICANCNDETMTTNTSDRSSNGINQTETLEINEQDLENIISRENSEETDVENTIVYYEDNQQFPILKTTKFDDYSSSQTNGDEYQHENSQYTDDSRIIQRIEQENEIESDEENERIPMFQANYQYTPLKDFAAMRNNRTNNNQNSPPDNSNYQPPSRYGGGLHYSNHGYDPTVTRLVEIPSSSSTNLTSSTDDSFPNHHRQTHFISTTNLNINEKPLRRQHHQSNSPPVRGTDSPPLKYVSQPPPQQQNDRYSTGGSDSGIVTISSASRPPQPAYENQVVEKKLTNLVEELGKQLENDAHKLNEKLELKLQSLEDMIHQQTFIIKKQDTVIEHLKGQILQIETERDHFRQQLSVYEQNDKKKIIPINQSNKFTGQEKQSEKKYSNISPIMTDNNKPPMKKTPAPRLNKQWSTTTDQRVPTISKLVVTTPIHRERSESNSSSASTVSEKLVSYVPLVKTPAASNRLDNIIHQTPSKNPSNPSSSSYSLAPLRHQQTREPISMEQRLVSSIHHDESDHDKKTVHQPKRSNSTSSSSSSSSSSKSLPPPPPPPPPPVQVTNKTSNAATNLNANKYPSFESIRPAYQPEQNPKLSGSLQFGIKPDLFASGSTSLMPNDSNQSGIQLNATIKGWLRKQNRESFLKRIERYYCILQNNSLLMHRHNYDQTPQKVIHLKGAKVLYYDDPKFGPSLELSWSNRSNDPKHYHLYAPNPQEAEQWLTGIQTAIYNLENKNNWSQYRMNI